MKSLYEIKAILNKKKRKKKTTKKGCTKVNYPWLKHSASRKAKAYLAFLTDHSKNAPTKASTKQKKQFFEDSILPRVKEKFPNLYDKIKKYYADRGKSLTRKHYSQLLYARLLNMYEDDFAIKSKEHPLKSKNSDLCEDYKSYEG